MIDSYIEYIRTISDASEEFALSSALALISGISLRRVEIPSLGSKTLYPNLWIMLLGASGISRKSTVIQPIRKILGDVFPEALLPDRMTEESTFAYFHTVGRAQAILVADEFAGTLANLDKQYAMGYKQLLMKMYDCVSYERRTLKSGDEIIRDAYLAVLGGGTPIGVMKYLSEKDIESGFLPRFLIVYPPLPDPKRILKRTIKADMLFRKVAAQAFLLRIILDQSHIRAVYDQDAFDYISDYFFDKEKNIRRNYNPYIGSIYARETEYAFKLSTLFALDEIIEDATTGVLDKLLRDIKVQPRKKKKDEEELPPVLNVYEQVMAFVDRNKTGENLAIALVNILEGFGKSFGYEPRGFKEYGSLYSYIQDEKDPLGVYQSGVLTALPTVDIPLRVTLEHVQRAIRYIEEREKDAMKIYSMVVGGRSKQIADKVFEFIRKREPVAHSVVLRNLNLNKNELKEAIQQLVEEERIEIKTIGRKRIYSTKNP